VLVGTWYLVLLAAGTDCYIPYQEINGLSQKFPWELGKWWVTQEGPKNKPMLDVNNSMNIQA